MDHSFLDFLISNGLITRDTANQVAQYSNENQTGIVTGLAKITDLSETKIARNISQFFGLPRFNYDLFEVDKIATELVSGIISVRLGILPYRFNSNGDVHVVCSDPQIVTRLLGEIDNLINGSVILEVGPLSAVRELAAFVHYGRSFSDDFDKQLSRREETNHDILSLKHTGHQDYPSNSLFDSNEHIPSRDNSDAEFIDTHSILSPVEEEDLFDFPSLEDEIDVDRQLAHIASLNEGSTAMIWDDEDTVVKNGAQRDEALKDFFFRNITARVESPANDAQRRQLLGVKSSRPTTTSSVPKPPPSRVPPPPPAPPSSTATDHAMTLAPFSSGVSPVSRRVSPQPTPSPTSASARRLPKPTSIPAFEKRSVEHQTPTTKKQSPEQDSELLTRLIQQSEKIQELESCIEKLTLRVSQLEEFVFRNKPH